MKTISSAMQAHLEGEVMTLCTCWKLVRKDGTLQGFTDNVIDLTYTDDDADTVTYEAATGFTPSNVASNDSLAVNNLDLMGLLDSDGLATDDLAAGVYDEAEVYIFMVNYEDLSMGDIKLSRGTLGEVTTHRNSFVAEFRGMSQKLHQTIGEVFSVTCRADLFDSRCGLTGSRDGWSAQTDYAVDDERDAIPHNGRYFKIVTAGRSGSTQPTWNTTVSALTTGVAEDVITDGVFATACGVNWTCGSAVISGGVLAFDGLQGASAVVYQSTSAIVGRTYTVTFDLVTYASGGVRMVCGSATTSVYVSASTYSENVTFTSTGVFSIIGSADFNGTIDNVVVEEVVPVWKCLNSYIDIGSVTSVTSQEKFEDSTRSEASSYYNYGLLTWVSGNNAGLSMEVRTFASKVFQLSLPMPYEVQVSDSYTVYHGCNKTHEVCISTFNNMVNFRGEPYIPGVDEISRFGGQ